MVAVGSVAVIQSVKRTAFAEIDENQLGSRQRREAAGVFLLPDHNVPEVDVAVYQLGEYMGSGNGRNHERAIAGRHVPMDNVPVVYGYDALYEILESAGDDVPILILAR